MYSHNIRKHSTFIVFGLLLLLCAPLVVGATQEITLVIGSNDIVRETVLTSFDANETYDELLFESAYAPLAVLSESEATLEIGEDTIITLNGIFDEDNPAEFTILLDEVISRSGASRVFSMHFTPHTEAITLSVILPEGYVLSELEPAVSPRPDHIRTNGREHTLVWEGKYEELNIIVLYQGPARWPYIALVLLLGIALIAAAAVFIMRGKHKQRLVSTLTHDEQHIVAVVRSGITKQKEVLKELKFTKPKMSKILRRLEEKDVIEREPYFKTNIIKIKKGWK